MGVFNAAEIIALGIEKEKKRRDFYAKVAEKFSDEQMRNLFTRLRDWEQAHIRKFSEIRDSVDETEPTSSYPGEFEDYLRAVVDDKLYNEVSAEGFSRKIKTALDAIQRGIEFEKDAILFFREILPFMDSSRKDAVQKVIDEEKKHLIYLAELKKKIT